MEVLLVRELILFLPVVERWVCVQLFETDDWQSLPISPNSGAAMLTATLLFMGEDVLLGGQHTISSQLEGLFISLLSISCSGKLVGRQALSTMPMSVWAYTRSGAMRCADLPEHKHIVPHLRPLVCNLHALFYPWVLGTGQRVHNSAVQPSEFQSLCQQYITESAMQED